MSKIIEKPVDDVMNIAPTPSAPSYNNEQLIKKKLINEIQGIASAIIYDGKIQDSEIEFLKDWLKLNNEHLSNFPLSDLKTLFNQILSDSVITEEERKSLFEFLQTIASPPNKAPSLNTIFAISPVISFSGKSFLFTGELVFGSRSKAQAKVTELGGIIHKNVRVDTNYLVFGTKGSSDYKYSGFGNKVETAIKLNRENNANIQIVKEEDFLKAFLA